jgi:GTP-binding protein
MKIRTVEFVGGAVSPAGMPTDGRPEIAFVGRSNVGKSSLVNRFLQRKRIARTSSTPGKTQEVNFFRINDSFYVVDLPGFGYARVSRSQRKKWQAAIGRYIIGREVLKVVFQLIDSRHAPTELDREVMLLLKESAAAHVILLTKSDKLSGNERVRSSRRVAECLDELHLEVPVVMTSAKDGRGRNEIVRWVNTFLIS